MIQISNAVNRFGELILNELKVAGITCWVAGGACRDYFSGKNKTGDIDLFFPDGENFIKCRNYFLDAGALPIWESDNGVKFMYKKTVFDLVKKYFATPTETISEFDFTVSMFAVDFTDVYTGPSSWIDLAKRQLIINKITYPASTLSRAFKYYKKGYTMCHGELKKLYLAINSAPKPVEDTPQETQDAPIELSADSMFSGFD